MTMCELQHKRNHDSYRQFLYFIGFACCLMLGCTKSSTENLPEVTSSSERASRRAFNGSPPVIPHQPFGAACVSCHNESGRLVAKIGFAPANPHKGDGRTTNCRQCHLFKTGDSETIFVKNDYFESPLAVDSDWYQSDITLSDPGGFEEGKKPESSVVPLAKGRREILFLPLLRGERRKVPLRRQKSHGSLLDELLLKTPLLDKEE